MHDTGAALAGVAADMGPGQVQMVAQEIDKKSAVLDVGRDRLAVHRQFDCRHVETSRCFLVVPIRSTGAGLCNWEFRRQSHCDVVFASTVVPAFAGTTPWGDDADHDCKFVPFSAPPLMVYSGPIRSRRKPRTPNNNAARRGFLT